MYFLSKSACILILTSFNNDHGVLPFLVAEVDAEVDDSKEILTPVVDNDHRNFNLESYLEHRWPNFEWNHLILKCKQSMKHQRHRQI